jgi:hypothetical protein
MPRTSSDPGQLLSELEAARQHFGAGHINQIARLIARISKLQLDQPEYLIRFHESLLFLRAFPHARSLIARVENLITNFHTRISKLRAADADMSVFDDFDTSGIAGTTMQDILSFDVARWLVRRIPNHIEIAWQDYWEDYQSERTRGLLWPRFIPLLEEDADVEATIPWQRWLDTARGREKPLPWLIRRFEALPLPARQRSELYESLRLPIRWRLENLKFTRTRNFTRPRRFFFHTSPLIQRSEVSLARELALPAPKFVKVNVASGRKVIDSLREFMTVRYRDLYGATLGDPRTVVRANFGRGTIMHLWGVPPDSRLPLRAYVCGYTLKNGVPINYFEAIGLCEWIEVGFNTFYTYRQGETAWIYAQALRCIRAVTGTNVFSIYPYQIGLENDEALDSGAFWFYRKLGFRSGRPDLQKLCEREEKKIAANRQYKSSRQILKRLAEAAMFYEVENSLALRKLPRKNNDAGPWDTFSVRNLALLVNHRMAREFNGDSDKIRKASVASVTRALEINSTRWSSAELLSLETWSLILALIPNLGRWTSDEKYQLVQIIRAKAAPSEMTYFHQTQKHLRLRAELLRLGSSKRH